MSHIEYDATELLAACQSAIDEISRTQELWASRRVVDGGTPRPWHDPYAADLAALRNAIAFARLTTDCCSIAKSAREAMAARAVNVPRHTDSTVRAAETLAADDSRAALFRSVITAWWLQVPSERPQGLVAIASKQIVDACVSLEVADRCDVAAIDRLASHIALAEEEDQFMSGRLAAYLTRSEDLDG